MSRHKARGKPDLPPLPLRAECKRFPDKNQYASAKAAKADIRRMRNRVGNPTAYKCSSCGRFHIGRKQKKVDD